MKVYLDTNVWVAALQPSHMHHVRSFATLARVQRGEIAGHFSGQGLAELYSVLTRMPFPSRIGLDEADAMLRQTVIRNCVIVNVTAASYRAAIATCVAGGWRGGRVHDAVHVQAAAQAGCKVIYTWNLEDLRSVAAGFSGRVEAPPELLGRRSRSVT